MKSKVKINQCPEEQVVYLFELMTQESPTDVKKQGKGHMVTFERKEAKIEYLVSSKEATFTLYPQVEGTEVKGTLTDKECIKKLKKFTKD